MEDHLTIFANLDGVRFLDQKGDFCYPGIEQVYSDSRPHAPPCFICGIYSEIYISGDTRLVYAESDQPYRADFKVGTLDKDGYFHFDPELYIKRMKEIRRRERETVVSTLIFLTLLALTFIIVQVAYGIW